MKRSQQRHPRTKVYITSWTLCLLNLLHIRHNIHAFTTTPFLWPSVKRSIVTHPTRSVVWSSVGDGKDSGNNNNNNNGRGSDGNLDDFLDPQKAAQESENLKKARAALSDQALPINYNSRDLDSLDVETESDLDNEQDDEEGEDDEQVRASSSNDTNPPSSIPGAGLVAKNSNNASASSLARNPYLNVVAKLSPSELISRFTSTAHPRVQEAVRSTILGLIGTLPKMAFETTTITTGERLASLMFQLQMTGYMFKNAEYRLSLSQSLGLDLNVNGKGNGAGKFLLEQGYQDDDEDDDEEDDENGSGRLSSGKVKGKIKVRYQRRRDDTNDDNDDADARAKNAQGDGDTLDDSDASAMEIEVDAAAYMAELRNEVSRLREDLISTRQAKEEAIRKDLLLYIRTLPQQELNKLTNTMTNDVLVAMKALVNVVMSGIGDGRIDRNTITEQSGEAMAQLCMWQLVVGYNLRELEVREEMKNALISSSMKQESKSRDDDDDVVSDLEGSIDYEEGGFE